MKTTGFLVIMLFFCIKASAQIEGNLLLGLTHATTAELSTINNPIEGSLLYNSTEKKIYIFNDSNWAPVFNLPADLADGDDDTVYIAGSGLNSIGTTFSVDNSSIAPNWGNIANIPPNLDLDSTNDFNGQWNSLIGIPSGFSDNVDHVDDADSDATNEIQNLSISGNSLTISGPGGNTVALPLTTETTTNLVQDTSTGVVTYTNEAATAQTVDIVSSDLNNDISPGSDGGAYLNSTISTTTVQIDQSTVWAGQVNDSDIHSNGTLTVQQTRADAGWSLAAPSTISFVGSPDYVKIDLMAVANNTGSHWAHPHIKVFRNGQEIGEGSGLHMDNSGSYSGRTTTVISMTDASPGTNPIYSFTTLEDDNRTMNNPTIVQLSPVSLIAVNKVDLISSVTLN